jgi:hypothetical protein
MAQTIAAVQAPHIEHGVLIDLELYNPQFNPDQVESPSNIRTLTYNISNCYTAITYNGKTYQALAGFIDITQIQGDLQNTNNEISLSLSAIPSAYIESVIGYPIKGGNIRIYRVFFDSDTQLVKQVSGQTQVFLRFAGIINNFAVQEDVGTSDLSGGDVTHTITITCSSILGVLENRVTGRRTNETSYQTTENTFTNFYYYHPNATDRTVESLETYITTAIKTDPSMSRVVALKNASFDFGKKA